MSFLGEMKRRKVFQVAAVYAVVAWLIMQVVDVVNGPLNLPEWFDTAVIFALAIGFPIALVLGWAFDITPDRVVRNHGTNIAAQSSGRRIEYVLIGLLVVAVGWIIHRESNLPDADTAGVFPNSVAVLSFENVSNDDTNEPFTVGIHDDLLTQISKIGSIRTISRTSVLRYRGSDKAIPQIAAELGVRTVLEGGVQRVGNAVRINVQLVDAQSDEHIWAETYDRELSAANIFAIQREIATEIANALKATLTLEDQLRLSSVPTGSLEALEAYFAGKQLVDHRTEVAIEAAIPKLEQAIAYDPNFALAHAGLAYAWLLLPEYSASIDRGLTRKNSEQAAARSLELNPDLPEGLTVMAWNHLIHQYDWVVAENLLRKALKLQANNSDALHWLSHVLSWQGYHEEAIKIAERAVESDPFSPLMRRHLSYVLMDARQYKRSIKVRDETLELDPDDPELSRNMWLSFLRAGRYGNAKNALTNWARGTGRNPQAATNLGRLLQRYAETGMPVELPNELLDELEIGSENLGQIFAAAGDAESALAALRIALDEHAGSRSVLSMKINPLFDFIRDDPRFIEMQEEAGLSP